jgi:hypothetical protein
MAQLLEIQQTGKREALLDIISVMDAHETPALSMLPKGGSLGNTLCEWQADKYRKPKKTGTLDGADVDTFDNKGADREMLYGRMMKSRDTFAVSDMAENVSEVAGLKKKEFAASAAKSLIEHKRDLEAIICGTQDSVAPTAVVAGVTRGMGSWISNSAQSDLAVPSNYRTPAASINATATASLAETDVQAVIKSIWQQRGQAKRLVGLVGIDLKQRFAQFTRWTPNVSSNTSIRTYNGEIEDKKVCLVVDFFEADGGTVELMTSNFLAVDANGDADPEYGYVVDPMDWALHFNRFTRVRQLEDRGGGPRGYTESIFTLRCNNPLGSGKFTGT